MISSIACGWSPVGTYPADVLSSIIWVQPSDARTASLPRLRDDRCDVHGRSRGGQRRRGGAEAATPGDGRHRPRAPRPRDLQGLADGRPGQGHELRSRAVRRGRGLRRRGREAHARDRDEAGDRRARHVHPVHRNVDWSRPRVDTDPRPTHRPPADHACWPPEPSTTSCSRRSVLSPRRRTSSSSAPAAARTSHRGIGAARPPTTRDRSPPGAARPVRGVP